MKQVVAPQHDALDDFEIFRRLSELFGVEYAFTEGKTPMDYVKDAYAASTASKHTPFEKFWADGMARIPVPPEAHKWVRHGDFRADPEKNPLHTHSGKIEMYSTTIAKMAIPDMPPMPTWQEPGEYLGNAKKGQVHVVSPHPYWRLHSQLNNSEKLRKRYAVQTREPLTISVQDAKANGIRDGDLVELHNARGALVVGARAVRQDHARRGQPVRRGLAAAGQQGALQQWLGQFPDLQPWLQRSDAGHHRQHLHRLHPQMHRCRSGRHQSL